MSHSIPRCFVKSESGTCGIMNFALKIDPWKYNCECTKLLPGPPLCYLWGFWDSKIMFYAFAKYLCLKIFPTQYVEEPFKLIHLYTLYCDGINWPPPQVITQDRQYKFKNSMDREAPRMYVWWQNILRWKFFWVPISFSVSQLQQSNVSHMLYCQLCYAKLVGY